eukprot:3958696-Prymnesium_polylepis.1
MARTRADLRGPARRLTRGPARRPPRTRADLRGPPRTPADLAYLHGHRTLSTLSHPHTTGYSCTA